jgi:hypothetical protein
MACIECIWAKENKFLVNPDGQVWPCCYLSNQGFKFKVKGQWNDPDIISRGVDDIVHPVMQEYWAHEEELNINNHSLEKILNHEWFTKTLPDSWKGNNPHRVCIMMCDKNG